jgi:hypothetical protein
VSIWHLAIHFAVIFFFTNAAIAQPLRKPIQQLPLLTPYEALIQGLNRPCTADSTFDPARDLAGAGAGYSVLDQAKSCALNAGEGALPDIVGAASVVGNVAECIWNALDCLSNASGALKATVNGLQQIKNEGIGRLASLLGAAFAPIMCSLLGGLLSRAALTLFTAGVGAAAIAVLVMTYLKKIQIIAKMVAVLSTLKMPVLDFLKMLEGMKEKSLDKLLNLAKTAEGRESAKLLLRACAT